jgi:hypothetical protein
VSTVPDCLTLARHRDGGEWWRSAWLRRGLLAIPLALIVTALLNAFGQRPITSVAKAPGAKLTVYAPSDARSGLQYAARIRVDATQDLQKVSLVFAPGWADGYTVNGLVPQPLTQGSRNGRPIFGFGPLAAGRHLTLWISLQVNPTNVGRHPQDVWLYDGTRSLAHIRRTITIYP